MTRRTGILLVVLVLAVAASFWPEPEGTVIEANKQQSAGASRQAIDTSDRPLATLTTDLGKRLGPASADLFATEMLENQAAIDVPRGPVVPPLPFAAVGRWQEPGIDSVFISAGDKVIAVKQGEVLQQHWRLDRIEPEQLVFTHLPTKTTQTMRIAP